MSSVRVNPLWSLDRELFIADGEPYVFGDTLYLYGSRDVPEGLVNGQIDWCSEDYHVVCSKDLVTWKDCGTSYTLDEIPGKDTMGDRPLRLWAPDVCYNPKDQKYYLFSCLNGGRGFFVASSDSPEGPFSNTKKLTIDGEDTFPKCIDPGVLLDDDGRAYITWPGGEAHPWSIAQLDPDDFSNILGDTITPVDHLIDPFEGPSLRKRGDTYYYIYIQNAGPRTDENIAPLRMAYLTGDSPLGPFKPGGLIIDTSDYPQAINVHGSIVEWKKQWYVFYHLPLQGYGRTRFACCAPLEFNPDGSIVPARALSCGPRSAFQVGETIPAHTAVIYSGGRSEQRCCHRNPEDRHLFFDRAGQYAGFRYVDFGANKMGEITIRAKCATSAIIEVRSDEHDGRLLARFEWSPAEAYQEQTQPLLGPVVDRHAVFLIMKKKQGDERVCVTNFTFH